jgi:DivIVA domain-containing protein
LTGAEHAAIVGASSIAEPRFAHSQKEKRDQKVADQTDSAAVSDVDETNPERALATKRLRWWPLVVLAIAGSSFGSWLVFVWLGIRTRARLWFVVAGVSATSVAVAFFVGAGTGPNSVSSTAAGFVSLANWVGAIACVLIVRRRSLRPRDPAEPIRWKTFYFAGPADVAWEGLTTAMAPMGGAVTSEDFHTVSVTRQSRVVVVEFQLALLPGVDDAVSALEVSRRHRWRDPFSGGRPQGWKGLDQLSRDLARVVVESGYVRSLIPPPPDATSVVRYVEFRIAVKGYNVGQVDELLDTLAAKLDRGEELFAEDVISNEFRRSWKGY